MCILAQVTEIFLDGQPHTQKKDWYPQTQRFFWWNHPVRWYNVNMKHSRWSNNSLKKTYIAVIPRQVWNFLQKIASLRCYIFLRSTTCLENCDRLVKQHPIKLTLNEKTLFIFSNLHSQIVMQILLELQVPGSSSGPQ